ncbi:hypothetical protein [Lysobacter gummosus]|uniref:hypothetical protein n=1 Tax=Lysobacter gummosus TaxID=262324 RepID=UPI00362D855C
MRSRKLPQRRVVDDRRLEPDTQAGELPRERRRLGARAHRLGVFERLTLTIVDEPACVATQKPRQPGSLRMAGTRL